MNKIHDFTNGKTAQYLYENRNIIFKTFRNVELIEIDGIKYDASKTEIDKNGFTIYKNGEERMLLFYYKQYFYLNWNNTRKLPKYHVVNCSTLKEYSGFVFANKMPVKITSRETNNSSFEKLELCKNCSNHIFKTWWGKNKPWFDAVLKYIEIQKDALFYKSGDYKGYHVMWKQISAAYKEKVGFKCESCKIDLSRSENKKWLHTHHKNGDIKDNKESNFESLCLLCHSLRHKEKLSKGNGFYEVKEFINLFNEKLRIKELKEFNILEFDSRKL